MEKIFCSKCKNELSNREIINGECIICNQRKITRGIEIFAIGILIVSLILGVVLAIAKPYGDSDFGDVFNFGLMIETWVAGICSFICFYIIYWLFLKLDIIIEQLKEK